MDEVGRTGCKKFYSGDYLGGPVVRTPCFQGKKHKFDSWWGTEIRKPCGAVRKKKSAAHDKSVQSSYPLGSLIATVVSLASFLAVKSLVGSSKGRVYVGSAGLASYSPCTPGLCCHCFEICHNF